MKDAEAAGNAETCCEFAGAMRGRSLLTLDDLTDDELAGLIDLSAELKRRRKSGVKSSLLAGKNVAMLFEKTSTRTRCAASVAVWEEGGHAEYLSSEQTHLGHKESVADTARVLGRMFSGILFRGYSQNTARVLAERAGVPVWNGLTDDHHPTQALADLLTVREHFGSLEGIKVVYCGDGRNNVAKSLMTGCAKTGAVFVDCTPAELEPDKAAVAEASAAARRNGGDVRVINDPNEAVIGANVLYTDVWASMGEESLLHERIRLLMPYRITMDMLRMTGNAGADNLIFLHCLPAFHDNNTELTKDIGPLEVTDDVFESEHSRVFDQAENRVHTIKALMAATL